MVRTKQTARKSTDLKPRFMSASGPAPPQNYSSAPPQNVMGSSAPPQNSVDSSLSFSGMSFEQIASSLERCGNAKAPVSNGFSQPSFSMYSQMQSTVSDPYTQYQDSSKQLVANPYGDSSYADQEAFIFDNEDGNDGSADQMIAEDECTLFSSVSYPLPQDNLPPMSWHTVQADYKTQNGVYAYHGLQNPPTADVAKIVSWNVNGLRALSRTIAIRDGVAGFPWNILIINELKIMESNLFLLSTQFPDCNIYVALSHTSAYAGVALVSTIALDSVTCIQVGRYESEGRMIRAQLPSPSGDKIALYGCYVPNAGQKTSCEHVGYIGERHYKRVNTWDKNVEAMFKQDPCQVLYIGDLNIAPSSNDLARPGSNMNTAGFTLAERESWSAMCTRIGLKDAWVDKNGECCENFTFWSNRSAEKKAGWRLDHVFTTSNILPNVTQCKHHPHVQGSDHCPISVHVRTEFSSPLKPHGLDWKTVTVDDLINTVPDNNWRDLFERHSHKLSLIVNKINLDAHANEIFPSPEKVFAAFAKCPQNDTLVVLLGQDPYPTPGDADGLAFSYSGTGTLPKSLKNLCTELENSGFSTSGNGDLSSWADQGVLLLNTTLTVRSGQIFSHKSFGWDKWLVDVLADGLADETVWLNFGGAAQAFYEKVAKKGGCDYPQFSASHPSPLSCRAGFFGCNFSENVNDLLSINPIDWTIP